MFRKSFYLFIVFSLAKKHNKTNNNHVSLIDMCGIEIIYANILEN